MSTPTIILASGSPRRRELLQLLGKPFEVVASNAPETASEHMTPFEACQLNAYRKARVVAKKFPDALVIGADTEVALGHRLFGKPATLKEAVAMLLKLQGKVHSVVTGVCLLHLRKHRQFCFAELTNVRFRRLSRAQRWEYLKSINPLDKAGGYAIQENGHLLVESIEGSFSNVVGLPMERLEAELKRFN
jgi:septum formation protein